MQKVYVVGLGPGGVEQMTTRAKETLAKCDVIAGYHVYINLIKEDFADKEFLSTGMRKEVDRCRLAVEEALKGKTVAMISSGDAGVYGMAGIMYQVAADHPELEIEVVPGITAACSGAAVLGAPLISGKKSPNVWTALLRLISASACTIRPALNAMTICKRRATLC